MNHIKHEELSWCGMNLGNVFYFKDIDQVIINNLHGERLPCQLCIAKIVESLTRIPDGSQLTTPATIDTV